MRTHHVFYNPTRPYVYRLAVLKSGHVEPPVEMRICVLAELAVANAVGGLVTVASLPETTDGGVDAVTSRGWFIQVKGTVWPEGRLRLDSLKDVHRSHLTVLACVDLEAWETHLLGWIPSPHLPAHCPRVTRTNGAGVAFSVFELEDDSRLCRDFDRLESVLTRRDAPPLPWHSVDAMSVLE